MHMIPGLPVLGRPRTRIKKSVLLSSLFYWAFTFFRPSSADILPDILLLE